MTHLHDNQRIAPVKVEGIGRYSWRYLAFWGVAGVILGKLLPWVDIFWEESLKDEPHTAEPVVSAEEKKLGDGKGDEDERSDSTLDGSLAADWNPAVRSIGAFIGIAFAIVRI